MVPRTHGMGSLVDGATHWSAVLSRTSEVIAVYSRASGARVTFPAVERFYTTVLLIRERATEGWHVSTLTMKES
jgi:hypothetical protein